MSQAARQADPSSAPSIAFAPGLDLARCRDIFARSGRIHIPNILAEPAARAIQEALAQRTAWSVTVVQSDGTRDFSDEQLAIMSPEQRATIDQVVMTNARENYVGRFRNHHLSHQGEVHRGGPPVFTALTEFLNGPAFLSAMREITGAADIAFADAQATCYDPGDFLHAHTDKDDEKKRRVAYVLNFTSRWRTEWGGLLGFVDKDGHVSEAFVPVWNALNLLRVNQPHYVSAVAPFAAARRYSVTGWLRAR